MKKRNRPTVAIIVLASTIFLGALTPVDATAGQESLVGSWIVDVMPDQPGPPPFRNLATNTSDGLVLGTAPELGTAHGIWTKTGPREFAVKFMHLVPVGSSFGAGTVTVTSTVTVDKDGDTATGPFTTVFDTTALQATVTGTVVLTRITFDQ
jgi:hypothetical protein